MSTNNIPSVSVCMICFNHAKYVRKSIDSILAQKTTFKYEILIHDDASTDGSSEIIKEYAMNYPDIIFPTIQEKNIYSLGGKPFSILFAKARGEYIALCECDDYWNDIYKLQKQFDLLNDEQNVSICYHNAIVVDENDNIIKESNIPDINKRDYTKSDLSMGRAAISTQTIMFRNKINPLPPEYYNVVNEDSFILMLLGGYGGGRYMADVQPSAYRVHSGGVWSSRSSYQKSIVSTVSYYWMSVYQETVNNYSLSDYYLLKSARNIIRSKACKVTFWLSVLSLYLPHIYRKFLFKKSTNIRI